MSAPQAGRVKELKDEEVGRPRSDSDGSRTRSWSGVDFDSPGRTRTFSERGEKKLVVVAVDSSKSSDQAFQWFLDTLCTSDAEYFPVLLHVPEIPSPPLVGDMSFSGEIWDNTFREEKAKVAKLKAHYEQLMVKKGISGKWLTLSTSKKPGEAIVKAAKEYHAQFIAMGARGISSFRKTFMGSVSDYVLHHCHCPVLICRGH